MSRRDIIIIAALVNAGLLAVLFMMAINSDEEKVNESTEISAQPIVLEVKPTDSVTEIKDVTATVIPATPTIADEVDIALKEFAANPTHPVVEHEEQNPYDDQDDEVSPQQAVDQPKSVSPETIAAAAPVPKVENKPETKYIEITVKRGDSLDKIARANGTTISSLKEINQLKNDKLKIGQILKVSPSAKAEKKSTETAKATKKVADTIAEKSIAEGESQFYTIKSGDNPWKIAKQFHIKVDEFLELNHLDEEKAKNLKVGEKVRIK